MRNINRRSIQLAFYVIINRPIIFLLFPFLLLHPIASKAQEFNACNFNIDNGLPSNHIYHAIKNKYGYLWIATDKGVVRYNGYEFKLFNISNGLPTDDIWELIEDKKARIWLGNISDEYGYIYNNNYHKAFVKGPRNIIYPQYAQPYGDGVIFLTRTIGADLRHKICIANDDTIRIYKYNNAIWPLLSDNERIYGLSRDSLCFVTPGNDIKIAFFSKADVTHFGMLKNRNYIRTIGNYLTHYSYFDPHEFSVLNLLTGKSEEYRLNNVSSGKTIQYIYYNIKNRKFYVISHDFIEVYSYEPKLEYETTYKISDLIPDDNIKGNKIKLFLEDAFWGTCVGTTTNGLWVNYEARNRFKKISTPDLFNYKYLGGGRETFFWWNSENATLLRMWKNKISKYPMKIVHVTSVLQYTQDTFLIFGKFSYFFMNHNSRIIKLKRSEQATEVYTGIKDNNNDIFCVSGFGFYQNNIAEINNSPKRIDADRYNGLSYNKLRGEYWAYNNYKVFIHKQSGDTVISNEHLLDFGVKKIENIVTDNISGNIFIKGTDNIAVFDPQTNTSKQLFENFIHDKSLILVYNNKLIVASKFGVLFSVIRGPLQISKPVLYPNIKDINYSDLTDCLIANGKLLLNTNKGVYQVDIPSDSEIINSRDASQMFSYQLVLNYRDTAINFKSGDTVVTDQLFRTLQFDIIKPTGNGKPRYAYQLPGDTLWHELNSNELVLAGSLKPGNYYKLLLKINDNVWKSDAIIIFVYIRPYWYQTVHGRQLTVLILSLLVVMLMVLTFLATRRYVLKAASKKHLRMELELKSMYAQMNPHFVFNTLNIALNMIKKEKLEDASLHISKFSRLLRSYLDSSRNRFTTLAEEINNTRNYIEIQQTRFAGIFDYEILLSSEITQPDKLIIPSLLLQPIVENAISHGLVPKEEGGHLNIEFGKGAVPDELVCTIEDNGIGRKAARLLNIDSVVKKESHGASLVNELIAIINKYEQFYIEIHYFDKEEPETGTIVQLKIKSDQYGKI